VTDKLSFEKVGDWMKQIQYYVQRESIAIVLVGNKCDSDNREVFQKEGEEMAKEFGVKYSETSALNNINVDETFNLLSQEIIKIKNLKQNAVESKPENTIELENKKSNKNPGNAKKCC
jgi:Ras-related protein Rab-8A